MERKRIMLVSIVTLTGENRMYQGVVEELRNKFCFVNYESINNKQLIQRNERQKRKMVNVSYFRIRNFGLLLRNFLGDKHVQSIVKPYAHDTELIQINLRKLRHLGYGDMVIMRPYICKISLVSEILLQVENT